MSSLAIRASEFWSSCLRSIVDRTTAAKQQRERAENASSTANAAVRALAKEIAERKVSTIAELRVHIEAIGVRNTAVVERADVLRRALDSVELLEPRLAMELGASVDAVRARLATSCSGYLAALEVVSREWQRFSGEADSVTNDKVAKVQHELAQLDAKKASVTGAATSNGERLIRECEDEFRESIAAIDDSAAPTWASRVPQYWSMLIATAVGGGVVAALLGAALAGGALAALLAGALAWSVLRWLDHSIEQADPERKASLRTQAQSVRNERIHRISREQESLVRSELERIAADARQLQRNLDEALGDLAKGRARAQQTARDMVVSERRKLEHSWGPLEEVATDVIRLTQTRIAKAADVAREAHRARVLSGMRECQSEIDAAVARELNAAPLKCVAGARQVCAPSALQPYLGNNEGINVPWVVDLMDSCHVKHDASIAAVDMARRLASWHAMEIWTRLGPARVAIADFAALGAGYGDLLSIAADDQHVTLLAAARDLAEYLAELMRTAAKRNRAFASSQDTSWVERRARAKSAGELAEVLVLEIPRGGLGTEQSAQVETLLAVGRAIGVTLIILVSEDLAQARAIPTGTARQVEINGPVPTENGFSLVVPSRAELSRMATEIVEEATTARSQKKASAGPPSSSFAEFMDAVVPASSRWRGDLADTADNIAIPVGVADSGEVMNLHFDDGAPHALLLGGTGSGKTNFLHTLIQAGCLKFSPGELRMFLADLKSGVSFEPYARLDGLGSHFGAVACTSSVVFGAVLIEAAKQEMQRRYEAFKLVQRRRGVSIDGLRQYRELADDSDAKLPRLLVIIDEFQVLFEDATRRHKNQENLVSLLKLGRQVGVHLMLATQSLRGRAGELDQALSQIHTRMILPAALSDANSIFRSMQLAQQAIAYCNAPGKCFMSRDFGEKGGIGISNPYRKDNGFFFTSLEFLAKASPPAEHLVPIVWSDAVGSLHDNFRFRTMRGGGARWYLGVPYGADHAVTVPLESGVTTAMVAVEERVHARALLGSLLMSLRQSYESVDVFWVKQNKEAGPLRRRDVDAMLGGLGLAEARPIDSPRAIAAAFTEGEGQKRAQVVIVPDAGAVSGQSAGGKGAWASPLTGGCNSSSLSDIDHLQSITSLSAEFPKIVLLLAQSIHDLVDGPAKAAAELASIRVSCGRFRGSRMRELMKVSDLPEMADDDLVVTTEESRRPIAFRPFEEDWN